MKVCTMNDVRLHKLPFEEALMMELEEKGYYTTSMLILQLISYQTEMVEKAGPGSLLASKPQLKDTKSILKNLSDRFTKAEDFHKEGKYDKECETFLKVSIQLAFSHPDWWWLGEQLLLQSITIPKAYPRVEAKYVALSRYAYAKFLIKNLKEMDPAYEQLVIVMELSRGKKWALAQIFDSDKGMLFQQACHLAHLCLMHKARFHAKVDIFKAIQLANLARKRAVEACYPHGETRALLLKGMIEVGNGMTAEAIATFSKAFYIQDRLDNLEGICETRLQLAAAYQLNGDTEMSYKTLMMAKEVAEENDLPEYLAQAYKSLGEFRLDNGQPKQATPLLDEALKVLNRTNNVQQIDQVRNLQAVSKGLTLFNSYIDMLLSTGDAETGTANLMKLIDWKDGRVQFWDEEELAEDEESTEQSDGGERSEVEGVPVESPVDMLYEDGTEEDREEVVELHFHKDVFGVDSYTDVKEQDQPNDLEEKQADEQPMEN